MISTTQNKTRLRRFCRKLLVAAFWLIVWELVTLVVGQEILVVSPVRTFQRLCELAGTGAFWQAAFGSLLRILAGFAGAVALGSLLAVVTCASPLLYDLFHPIISLIKATPVASFIILALVWLPTANVPSFASFLMVTPIVWGNVYNGLSKTDRNLLQMARVYRFGRMKTAKRVYLPSVMPYFTAACTTGMGLAWKAGIAAEVLANTVHSIGGYIYDSKIYLETADLFAWTAVVILLSVLLEGAMVRLMRAAGKKYNAV